MKLIVGLGNQKIMKLIVGLGNPGLEYAQTRHNVGFRVVDKFANAMGWKWSERRARAILATGTFATEKVALAKPITYMNLSGEAVGELVRWYKLLPADILVVSDELDLPLGRVRIRLKGNAGGHNGIDNIIKHLHTNEFPRLRIGIGRPNNGRMDGVSYVLGAPPLDERIQLAIAEDQAVDAIRFYLLNGPDAAMNAFNIDPEAAQKAEEKRRRQLERREQEQLRREAAQREAEPPPSKNRAKQEG